MSDDTTTRDDLERLIAVAFQQGDPVPASVGGPTPFVSWLSPDAGVAFIVDEDDVLAVRGPVRATGVRFRSETHSIEVEIERNRLAGTIRPWAGGSATIEIGTRIERLQIDEFGDFAGPAPAGIARLRFETDREPVVSDWFLVSHDPDS